MQKIQIIYNYYIKQKLELDKNNSSFAISLAELCPEYEIFFRKMILTIISNIPGEGIEYSLIARLFHFIMEASDLPIFYATDFIWKRIIKYEGLIDIKLNKYKYIK